MYEMGSVLRVLFDTISATGERFSRDDTVTVVRGRHGDRIGVAPLQTKRDIDSGIYMLNMNDLVLHEKIEQ
jgi:hypothetical protein